MTRLTRLAVRLVPYVELKLLSYSAIADTKFIQMHTFAPACLCAIISESSFRGVHCASTRSYFGHICVWSVEPSTYYYYTSFICVMLLCLFLPAVLYQTCDTGRVREFVQAREVMSNSIHSRHKSNERAVCLCAQARIDEEAYAQTPAQHTWTKAQRNTYTFARYTHCLSLHVPESGTWCVRM